MYIELDPKDVASILIEDPDERIELIFLETNTVLSKTQFMKYKRKVTRDNILTDATAVIFSRHQEFMVIGDLALFPGKWGLFTDLIARSDLADINPLLRDNTYVPDKAVVALVISADQLLDTSKNHEILSASPNAVAQVLQKVGGRMNSQNVEHVQRMSMSLTPATQPWQQIEYTIDLLVVLYQMQQSVSDFIVAYDRDRSLVASVVDALTFRDSTRDEKLFAILTSELKLRLSTLFFTVPYVSQALIDIMWDTLWAACVSRVQSRSEKRLSAEFMQTAVVPAAPSLEELLLLTLQPSVIPVIQSVLLDCVNYAESAGIAMPTLKHEIYSSAGEQQAGYNDAELIADKIVRNLPADFIKNYFGVN